MAFYLIGLGMNKNSISADALEAVKSCDKVYLENYTVDFPYSLSELDFEFEDADRDFVESEKVLEEAKEKNVALLVYGDALSATTHMQLILSCKKRGISYRIFHNASILTSVGEIGLSLYKFGKTASIPDWKEHTNKPKSFMEILKENRTIDAHTLMLVDIGLDFSRLKEQLGECGFEEEKILVVSKAGTDEKKIIYRDLNEIEKVEQPYCLIVPGKLNDFEEGVLENL